VSDSYEANARYSTRAVSMMTGLTGTLACGG
jgi:hypothetical protein